MLAFYSFLAALVLFLYAALAPILDFTISPDFKVYAWGFFFLTLGFLAPLGAGVRGFRGRRGP